MVVVSVPFIVCMVNITAKLDPSASWHTRIVYPCVILLGSTIFPYIIFMSSAFLTTCKTLQEKQDKLSCGLYSVFYRACITGLVFSIVVMITVAYGALSELSQHGMTTRRLLVIGPAMTAFITSYHAANRTQSLANTVG